MENPQILLFISQQCLNWILRKCILSSCDISWSLMHEFRIEVNKESDYQPISVQTILLLPSELWKHLTVLLCLELCPFLHLYAHTCQMSTYVWFRQNGGGRDRDKEGDGSCEWWREENRLFFQDLLLLTGCLVQFGRQSMMHLLKRLTIQLYSLCSHWHKNTSHSALPPNLHTKSQRCPSRYREFKSLLQHLCVNRHWGWLLLQRQRGQAFADRPGEEKWPNRQGVYSPLSLPG